ncbi:MAG: hypothetical protein Ta2E_00290 [Mycoplasmoidaceae bacterium]|nr:MAG: hypothetical protein Ta2E_00290 [Mycoplasmoidaceae bacterium]
MIWLDLNFEEIDKSIDWKLISERVGGKVEEEEKRAVKKKLKMKNEMGKEEEFLEVVLQ